MQFPKMIGEFTRRDDKPNAINSGALYELKVQMSVPFEQERMLRVYLPEDYDENETYPVMYMTDGQNAVDRFLSAYGEWDIDDHISNLIKEGYKSFIVVGLDCPKKPFNRVREYVLASSPYHMFGKSIHGYGRDYARYLLEVVKPLIDSTFSTRKEKEFTAFAGSSMGGLCAFEMGSLYQDIFGFLLVFSPSFAFFKWSEYLIEVEERNIAINAQKYYFYCGGRELDDRLLPGTVKMYEYMKSIGFDDEHNALLLDYVQPHNEAAWSYHFEDAIRFWNIKK